MQAYFRLLLVSTPLKSNFLLFGSDKPQPEICLRLQATSTNNHATSFPRTLSPASLSLWGGGGGGGGEGRAGEGDHGNEVGTILGGKRKVYEMNVAFLKTLSKKSP